MARRRVLTLLVHCSVSGILLDLLTDAVGDVGLLQQGIANVFLIGQDVVNHLIGPALDPAGSWSAVRLQLRLDLTQTAPVQIAAEDPLYRLRVLRHDLRLTVLTPAVSQQLAVLESDLAVFHTLLLAPGDNGAEGFALRLGKAAEQGDEELAGLGKSVDILLWLPFLCALLSVGRPSIAEGRRESYYQHHQETRHKASITTNMNSRRRRVSPLYSTVPLDWFPLRAVRNRFFLSLNDAELCL